MSEEQQSTEVQTTTPTPSASIVPVEGGNLELSAQSPDEIVQCHSAMIRWCENKVAIIQGESEELKAATLHAKKQKWASGTLEKQWKMMERRVEFYQKMLAALKAGYHIIPPMDIELFAIRTDKVHPSKKWKMLRYETQGNFDQSAKMLPGGQGTYEDPQPIVKSGWPREITQQDGTKVEKTPFWADQWAMIEFPANMARVHVMEATTRAMALKVFDDIGMLPADRQRNPDPMIVGRIHDPRGQKWNRKLVYFLIAWHIDTRGL